MKTKLMMFLPFLLILISVMSLQFGLTASAIPERPIMSTETPSSGITDFLTVPIQWAVNTAGSFIQLMAFQTPLPELAVILILYPLLFGFLYILIDVLWIG